jgi:hypothetical protein
MRRLGDLAVAGNLLKGVDALSSAVESVHQMHLERVLALEEKKEGQTRVSVKCGNQNFFFGKRFGFERQGTLAALAQTRLFNLDAAWDRGT